MEQQQQQQSGPRTKSRSRRAEVNATEYDRDPLDFYIEDEWCWEAIFQRHRFLGNVWDPACGSGTIGRACRVRDMPFRNTDIVDRGDHQHGVYDFLDAHLIVPGTDNILCNPPYGMPYKGICLDFTLRALEIARHQVCMIYQNKFLHGGVRTRRLFEKHRPRAIYIFGDRPNMPPGDLFLAGKVERGGGSKDYIAIVWDKTYNGPTITEWLFEPGKTPRGLNGTTQKAPKDRGHENQVADRPGGDLPPA
jgi:hypothetical protein